MNDLPSVEWYCVKAKIKREHIAAAVLHSQSGLEVFCPRISIKRKTATGSKVFTDALFPGYFFARFNQVEDLRRVMYANDVRGVVSFGDKTPAIAAQTIDSLKEQFPENSLLKLPSPAFETGDAVEIVAGILFGQTGTLTHIDNCKDMASLLVEFLGHQIQLQVPTHNILKQVNCPKVYPNNLLAHAYS